MKQFLLFFLILIPAFSFTQSTEGTILYKETIIMDFEGREMPPHVKEMMKDMPKEQSVKKMLTFTAEESFFGNYDDPDAEPIDPSQYRGPMRWMMMRAEEETYVNYAESRMAQQKEAFGRTFLIKDSLEARAWKVTGETKTIQDYTVMKATRMQDSIEVVAWFCPTIPVPGGPEGMGQLPGMILEASARDGKLLMVAEKIEFREVKDKEIVEPDKGKEMTREEFRTMMKEKREEMRQMRGRNGGGHWGGGRPR